ncbi:hypothetical protein Clacol_002664 [Clathrus columnatus]|uniref:Conserved oligomeric Golgi complex subunit 6 n=1 Tax=Clathrus columnatus TaxID=1419009 RepID=A0AAV5A1B5_9AGAM|nr:hypothetical protein Clacol_002664 [Clathrus columnatus]
MSSLAGPSSPRETVISSPIIHSKGLTSNATWNPISLRLYKVLGANYDDPRTRDALETLSTYYAPSHLPTSTRRADHGENTRGNHLNNASESGKLREVRTYNSGDTATCARKSLRRDTEARLAEGSEKFLKAFGDVDDKLNMLEDFIQEMTIQCDEAEAKLKTTTDACKHLLDKAEGLRSQRQQMGARLLIVNAFLSEFSLTQEETEALTSRDIPVGNQMLMAIDRIETIRERCQLLLSEDSGTNAGLDTMAVTSSLLDQAYQKIYRWCSFEFRQFGKDRQLEVDSLMKDSMKRLKHQPDLFSEALKSLSQTRQSALLAQFLDALTRGGPSGFPRPIEIHAHDPTRYIGDMLGWVHQAVAEEHEFLNGLFDIKDDGRMVGSVRTNRQDSDEERWVRMLLNGSIEKLSVPLRLRVQQTVKSQESIITSYKIANILQFYLITMRRTIGDDALLCQTLGEITDIAYKAFFDAVEAQGRSLLRFLHPPDDDLSAPLALRDFCQVLREIMIVYESSVLNIENPEEQRRGFKRILDTVLDPALEMCRRMADMNTKDVTGWEKSIFLVNCLDYLQSVMQPYPFTNERIEELEAILQSYVKLLSEQHCTRLLQESGLAPILETMKAHDATATTTQEVTAALRAFDSFLSKLDVISSPRLELLAVPRLATLIHRTALKELGDYYGSLCAMIKDPKNKYEFASTLLGSQRPFGQMDVLWQVMGVEDLVYSVVYSR